MVQINKVHCRLLVPDNLKSAKKVRSVDILVTTTTITLLLRGTTPAPRNTDHRHSESIACFQLRFLKNGALKRPKIKMDASDVPSCCWLDGYFLGVLVGNGND